MVKTEISQNTKTNYGRNKNIIQYKNELKKNRNEAYIYLVLNK